MYIRHNSTAENGIMHDCVLGLCYVKSCDHLTTPTPLITCTEVNPTSVRSIDGFFSCRISSSCEEKERGYYHNRPPNWQLFLIKEVIHHFPAPRCTKTCSMYIAMIYVSTCHFPSPHPPSLPPSPSPSSPPSPSITTHGEHLTDCWLQRLI